MTFARRMSRVTVSPTLKVSAEADRLRRTGVDVVDLGAGEPDFGTPEHVKAAAHAALTANFTKYTPSAGVLEFRDAVAHDYSQRYGVSVKADEVIISAGAKQALYNAAMVLFDQGDEVITHSPFWPTIVDQIKLADATPVLVQTHREDGFAIRAGAIIDALTPKTRAIIINSPCNPTGALMAEADMIAIADAAAARGIWVIADVTYEHLIYDPVPHNLVKILLDRMPDRTVICSSASKSYAMTGWRCGWAIGPKPLIAQCNVLQGHAEGRHRRADRAARRRHVDARRVPQAAGCRARLAHRRSAVPVRQALGCVLPVPVRGRSPLTGGPQDHRRAGRGPVAGGGRRRDARRGV